MDNKVLEISGTTETQPFYHSSKKILQAKREKNIPSFSTMSINQSFINAGKTIIEKKNIFGDLLTEGDLSILFGRSNVGKSFLGFQIAQAIAQGINVLSVFNPIIENETNTKDFNLNNEISAQKVIYFDFEGTKEKNYVRYRDRATGKPCKFSDNLLISYPDNLSTVDNLMFIDAIEKQTIDNGVKVVIIDNLSAISADNEKSGNAVKLMNKIKDFQRRNNLTVLIMAHTPKVEEGRPIISNNLAGSANIFNLADSVMAINTTSIDKLIRYIKQLKARYSEIHYDMDNVITMSFNDRADGFKGFNFLAYESEEALIKIIEKSEKDEENDRLIDLCNLQDMSYTEMANELYQIYGKNVSSKTYRERIIKRIKTLKSKGLIHDRPVKPAINALIESTEALKPTVSPTEPLKPTVSPTEEPEEEPRTIKPFKYSTECLNFMEQLENERREEEEEENREFLRELNSKQI